MARTIDLTVDWEKGTIKQAIAELPDKMLDYAYEVLIEQAKLIVGLAQIYVPVDTGSLRDSIRVERGGEGVHWRRVSVRAGGYIVNPRTGKLVNYAVYVEERQPYLRPAVEEVKSSIEEMIEAGVAAQVGSQT